MSDATPSFSACLGAYLRVYQRRRERRASKTTHDNPELEALTGLVAARLGRRLTEDAPLTAALAVLDEVTCPILSRGHGHSAAIDVAGVAWAEAYGRLTLPEPAFEHLEWVLEQTGSPRPIRGLLGVGWRALFLARALPQLNWRTRRRAEAELAQRTRYLVERSSALDMPNEIESSSALRLTYVLAEAASDGPLAEWARACGNAMLNRAPVARLTTAALCQAAMLAKALGRESVGRPALELAVKERLNEQSLLTVAPDSSRLELTPWVPLALIEYGASAAPVPTTQVWARARTVVSYGSPV